jgi:hypothetical protein
MGWDSASGFFIAFLSTTTTPSKILYALSPSSTTCKGFNRLLYARGTCEPGRRGLSLDKSLVIVEKLLSNFVIHDCMDETLSITSTYVL